MTTRQGSERGALMDLSNARTAVGHGPGTQLYLKRKFEKSSRKPAGSRPEVASRGRLQGAPALAQREEAPADPVPGAETAEARPLDQT